MVEKKCMSIAPRVAYIFVSAKEEKRRGKGTFFSLAGKMVMKSRAFSRSLSLFNERYENERSIVERIRAIRKPTIRTARH